MAALDMKDGGASLTPSRPARPPSAKPARPARSRRAKEKPRRYGRGFEARSVAGLRSSRTTVRRTPLMRACRRRSCGRRRGGASPSTGSARDIAKQPSERPSLPWSGDHVGLGIPGVVNDDRARLGVVVGPVEAADLHRKAVFAVIIIAGGVGAVRGRVGPEIVREALDEARMVGVRAAAVGDEVAVDLAAGRSTTWKRGSLDGCEKSTMPMKSRRRSGADRAPPWRAGTAADRCRPERLEQRLRSGRKRRERVSAAVGKTIEGSPTELAAEDSIAPAAPTAPRRNISLRFNDIRALRSKRSAVIHSERLIADNPTLMLRPPPHWMSRFVAMLATLPTG